MLWDTALNEADRPVITWVLGSGIGWGRLCLEYSGRRISSMENEGFSQRGTSLLLSLVVLERKKNDLLFSTS